MQSKLDLAMYVREKLEAFAGKFHVNRWGLRHHCALGTIALASAFGACGIPWEMVQGCFVLNHRRGRMHAWLESDGEIFDITATQFDKTLPRILIAKAGDKRYRAMDRYADLSHPAVQHGDALAQFYWGGLADMLCGNEPNTMVANALQAREVQHATSE